jgi:hypothetical protein
MVDNCVASVSTNTPRVCQAIDYFLQVGDVAVHI